MYEHKLRSCGQLIVDMSFIPLPFLLKISSETNSYCGTGDSAPQNMFENVALHSMKVNSRSQGGPSLSSY